MTGCSVVRKGGGWYVKCEHESGRSTPGIPTGSKEVEDMLPKSERKQPLGPLTNPDQGPWLRPPPSLAEICEANPKAPICFKPGPEPAVIQPVGSFYSVDVRFEHNRPSAAQAGRPRKAPTGLAYVVERLQADPTLQVQLVGHASSEGTEKENLQLSVRRAKAIYAALAAKGLGARVMDLVGGREPGRLHARRVRHLGVRRARGRRPDPPGGPQGRGHVPAQRAGAPARSRTCGGAGRLRRARGSGT